MREEQSADQRPRLGLEVRQDEIVLNVEERSFWVPRNSITVLLAQMLLFALVVGQIGTALRGLGTSAIGVVDEGFAGVDYVLRRTEEFITSENTENLLSNVQKILVIVLITLIILDVLNVVSFAIPKWVLAF